MREPDLAALVQWLGVDRHAVTWEPGLAWRAPRGAGRLSLPRLGGLRENAWSCLGRAFVRDGWLPTHLKASLAGDWRYRTLLALPAPLLEILLPKIIFPAGVAGELGAVIFEGKTRIKVFRRNGEIINIVKEGCEELFLADILVRQNEAPGATLTPGIIDSGRRGGVYYFTEPYIPGDPPPADCDPDLLLAELLRLLDPWYETNGIELLGNLGDVAGSCATRVRALLEQMRAPGVATEWHSGIRALLAQAEELAERVSEVPVIGTKIHGDLNPGNILQARRGWVLLDWECSRRASFSHDAINFISWLAVFRGDYQPIREALRGGGAVGNLLASRLAVGTGRCPPRVIQAYMVAYMFEKLLLQLITGSRTGSLLDRRMQRWKGYWSWLLRTVTDILSDPAATSDHMRLT